MTDLLNDDFDKNEKSRTNIFGEANHGSESEVRDLMNRLKGSNIYNNAKTSAILVEKNVREFIEERPLTVFLGAVALGYMATLLLNRKGTSHGTA